MEYGDKMAQMSAEMGDIFDNGEIFDDGDVFDDGHRSKGGGISGDADHDGVCDSVRDSVPGHRGGGSGMKGNERLGDGEGQYDGEGEGQGEGEGCHANDATQSDFQVHPHPAQVN